MKHTVLLIDYADPESSSVMIVDDKQKELLKEVFSHFEKYDDWQYAFFKGTEVVQDFTKEDTSTDEV